jgi:hypothetical protein
MTGYVIDYFDEFEYAALSRGLKKFNKMAFEKLTLEYYPYLKCGKFVGQMISKNDLSNTETYEVKLPCTKFFAHVHGEIRLRYIVSKSKNVVMLDTIYPSELLIEGADEELEVYRGVVISRFNEQKNKVMIDMLLSKEKLEDLDEYINTDINSDKCICPHCNGTGYIN